MHIIINQDTSAIEEVSTSVVATLYQLANSTIDPLDNTSLIRGRINAAATYLLYITDLLNKFSELYITASKYYLYVGDSVFERICAENWGDGTGVVLADLTAVTDLTPYSAFRQNTQITDATGFKYFTNMYAVSAETKRNYGTFYGCSSLEKCELPPHIKTTDPQTASDEWGWFSGCTSLTQCILPAGFEVLGSNMFYGCSSLQTIDLSNTSTVSIGTNAFKNCSSLSTILLPNTLNRIGSYAFMNSGLTSITIPNSVTSIRNTIFDNCSQLSLIIFESGGTENLTFDTGTAYTNNIFSNGNTTPLLTSVDFPERLTDLSKHPFRNTSLRTIIFRGSTPPTVTNGLALPSAATIYVPDASLSTYQAATGFSEVSSLIKGISELPS